VYRTVHAFQFSSRHVYLPRNGLSPFLERSTEKNGSTISSSADYQGTSSLTRDFPASPHERASALPPMAGRGRKGTRDCTLRHGVNKINLPSKSHPCATVQAKASYAAIYREAALKGPSCFQIRASVRSNSFNVACLSKCTYSGIYTRITVLMTGTLCSNRIDCLRFFWIRTLERASRAAQSSLSTRTILF